MQKLNLLNLDLTFKESAVPLNFSKLSYTQPPASAAFSEAVRLTSVMDQLEEEALAAAQAWSEAGKSGCELDSPSGQARLASWEEARSGIFPALLRAQQEYPNVPRSPHLAPLSPAATEAWQLAWFLLEPAPNMILSLLFSRSDDFPVGFISEVIISSETFAAFSMTFAPYFGMSQLDELWKGYKVFLDSLDSSWCSEDRIAACDPTAVSAPGFTEERRRGLRMFLEHPEGSSWLVGEALALVPDEDFYWVLGVRRNFLGTDHFKTGIGVGSLAGAVKALYPGFFFTQLAFNGVDGRVASMLLPSWRGSFPSFLAAAKSLSADSPVS